MGQWSRGFIGEGGGANFLGQLNHSGNILPFVVRLQFHIFNFILKTTSKLSLGYIRLNIVLFYEI